jgi:putative copper export protein
MIRGLSLVTPLLLAADFYLWLQHASPTATVDGDTLAASLSTQGGAIYLARLVLTVLAIWAIFLVRRPGLATILVGAAALITAATGHPAAIHPAFAIPGKAIHLLGVALWSGGLLMLVFAEVGEQFSAHAHRVSSIALISVIAVALTGAVETVLFLPRLGEIFSSTYGFLVLAKLGGLAGLVAFGAWHKFRVLRQIASGTAGPDSLRRSVAWETGLMSAVMITAAFLAYVSPPPPPGSMPGTHHHAVPAPAETDH